MQNLEHVYDGIYGYNQDEEVTIRDKSGGIGTFLFTNIVFTSVVRTEGDVSDYVIKGDVSL